MDSFYCIYIGGNKEYGPSNRLPSRGIKRTNNPARIIDGQFLDGSWHVNNLFSMSQRDYLIYLEGSIFHNVREIQHEISSLLFASFTPWRSFDFL